MNGGAWSLEKRRSFVRMVTDSVTLEEIASRLAALDVGMVSYHGLYLPDGRAVQERVTCATCGVKLVRYGQMKRWIR